MGSKIRLHRSVHHVEDYHRREFDNDWGSFHRRINGGTRRRTPLHLPYVADATHGSLALKAYQQNLYLEYYY